jgi:hypothetical protein
LPYEGDLGWGEDVGFINEVVEDALQGQGFGAEGAGGFDGARVFVAQRVKAGGGQGLLLATDALHFALLRRGQWARRAEGVVSLAVFRHVTGVVGSRGGQRLRGWGGLVEHSRR